MKTIPEKVDNTNENQPSARPRPAPQSASRPGARIFNLSFFRGKADAVAKQEWGDWATVVSLFKKSPRINQEKDGPLFSPATFKDNRRGKENAVELEMAVKDFDGDLTILEAEKRVRELGVDYAIYTTHSHQRVTERHQTAVDCFRVVIPLAEPIPAAEFPYLWEWMNAFFQGKADPACRDTSRMFYLPLIAAPDAPYAFSHRSESNYLDWREPVRQMREIEAARKAIETEKARRGVSSKSGGALRPGDDYNARGDLRALLAKHGWARERDDSVGERWRRPGKDKGHGAHLYHDSGLLYVFTSGGAPFKAGQVYNRFAVYALLEHNGDFEAAAKALAGEGYGERRETKQTKGKAQAEQTASRSSAPASEVVAHAIVLNKILEALQPSDFYALGGFQPQSEIKQKHYVVLCIRQLLKVVAECEFALARKNDFIFVYNGEYWREIERDMLKDFLGKAAARFGVNEIEAQHYEFKDKLYKQFLAAAHFEQTGPENGKALVNLKNGTFEITADSQELRVFNAADFLKYQLPFDYNKEAEAPIFTAYLNRVLPEIELQNIVAEFFGYVFTRRLKLEKALLLYGLGANGKSVLFDVMNALLLRISLE